MFKNRSVDVHQFAMVPRADIPRSSFNMQKGVKTTFDAGYLVPVLCEEVLPGDSFNLKMTAFTRMATPIFPFMDNLYLESFFFFVPNRLVWNHWVNFMGENANPVSSPSPTTFTIPQCVSPAGGYGPNTIFDHFGLPTVGQVDPAGVVGHSALPLRMYYLIYNDWFKDENLIDNRLVPMDDGPDSYAQYALMKRGKRHDYFTSCLPWTQKGPAINLPLGGDAPIVTCAADVPYTGTAAYYKRTDTGFAPGNFVPTFDAGGALGYGGLASGAVTAHVYPSNLFADLSVATAATINQLRQAFQIQKLLERDARGGTRYTEIVRSHFGVLSPDARLQRPEYLGGGQTPISINPVAQTSATSVTGSTSPLGNLSGFATALAMNHGFSKSFVEHGYVIGLVNVRADLTYQQGLRRHWSRNTRYDFYFPVFAQLGEQAVLLKELYCKGLTADSTVFGYQERWAEYRYNPSEIHGLFRSTTAGTLDAWHLAQKFTAAPTLGQTFIEESPPIQRVSAVNSVESQQFLSDIFFDIKAARPMPMYSVPGLIDHF